MSLKLVKVAPAQAFGARKLLMLTADFDDSYPTNGEEISLNLVGMSKIDDILVANPDNGTYVVVPDVANHKLKVLTPGTHTHTGPSHQHAAITAGTPAGTIAGTAPTAADIVLKDSDNAAVDGVAMYVHTNDGVTGWIECVNAGNADSKAQMNATGAFLFVRDSDSAATAGCQVYIDEDAANQDERLLATLPLGTDVFIPLSDGTCIRIKHHAAPGTPGVAAYFDDDAATAHNRILFVSPTNADGTAKTDDTFFGLPGVPAATFTGAALATHQHAAAGTGASGATASSAAEVGNGTNLAALTGIRVALIGR